MATRPTRAAPAARPAPTRGSAALGAKPERQFYSPDDPIRVALLDGSIALVTSAPRTLPPKFWKQALKDGCFCTDQVPRAELDAADQVPGADAFQRRDAIKDAICAAVDAQETPEQATSDEFRDAFNANDVPNVRWIEKRVGFGIDASERDEVWAEIQRELEAEREDDNLDDEGGA